MRWALSQWALTTPVLFWLGARLFIVGVKALRTGAGNRDLPVATDTRAAYGPGLATGAPQTANDPGAMPQLSFEGAAVVITLVLFGNWLEARAKRGTLVALDGLKAMRPDKANVRRAGIEQSLPLAEVLPGDEVLMRPGERVPTDGVVVKGRSHLNKSLLTSESLPVTRQPSDTLTGGAINGEGSRVVRTTAIGAAGMLPKISQMVESAQAKQAPIQQAVDLVAAVLVIACPCALGLASPATLMVGSGLAARYPDSRRPGTGADAHGQGGGLRQDRHPDRGPVRVGRGLRRCRTAGRSGRVAGLWQACQNPAQPRPWSCCSAKACGWCWSAAITPTWLLPWPARSASPRCVPRCCPPARRG
jgi:cation transport ATPase